MISCDNPWKGTSRKEKKKRIKLLSWLNAVLQQSTTGGVFTIRSEVEGLFDLPAVHHVPQPDSSVPGGAGQNRLDRTEAQAANWTLVAPQNLMDQH